MSEHMSFERFGKISYVSQSKLSGFIKFLEEGKIAGTICEKCGKIYFPPRADCGPCLCTNLKWIELSGEGKIESFTNIHYPPTSFKEDAPYILAAVRLKEGPVTLTTLNKSESVKDIFIGMPVHLVPVELSDDRLSFEARVK